MSALFILAHGVPCCGPGNDEWRWWVIVPVAVGVALGLVAWWLWWRGWRKRRSRPSSSDDRPPRGWWAPGSYTCRCQRCGLNFDGDKRAQECADCVYGTKRGRR